MNALVRCAECDVWIHETESIPADFISPFLPDRVMHGILSSDLFPNHWRTCVDRYACVRRQKDKVGAPSSAPHE